MHADLDTLCTVVYCTAADLLPEARRNARRRLTDAEVVTLCVAQAIMGIPSDRRFLAVARTRLVHLFPDLPGQAGYFKRRRRLADTIEWLMAHFAAQSPGYRDELLLIDSTPVECARSCETVKRSALAELAGYGYCASHSRFFWGLRLHLLAAPDGTPRALTLASPKRDEREVGLELLERCARRRGELLICDKGYAGREFAAAVADLGALVVRPARKDEPGRGPHLAPIRQRIESIFWTAKDLLTLERHGARTMAG
ncbi:MAG TPA: IS982 family transposase, partial [Candidatus Limnocylindrales bacterium]